MFEFGPKHSTNLRGEGIYPLKFAGKTICYIEAWAFASCASSTMYGFAMGDYTYAFWKNEKNIQKLVDFLDKNQIPNSGWIPKEHYFLITKRQAEVYMKHLVAHPCVKLVDVYANKAHDATPMHLYRLSTTKDFNGTSI